MNAQVGGRGIALPTQTSGLDVVCGQVHVPAALTPGNKTGTHCAGGWVGIGVGLDMYETPCQHRSSNP
jgi:hypothetical protein